MWDVPRFAEVHDYPLIVIENVVDARDWVMYPAWLAAMGALGYEHGEVFLNSMVVCAGDWGAPQSRDRMYVCFWKKGARKPELDYRPPSWCYWCEREVEGVQTWKRPDRPYGRYRQQYVYSCSQCHRQVAPFVHPAARAIDWTIVGRRIGERARPLAAVTMARIQQGIAKYWGHDLVVPLDRLRAGKVPLPIEMPMPTATARRDKGLLGLPFICENHGTSTARSVGHPLMAVVAGGNHHALCEPPLYVKGYGPVAKAGPMAHMVTDPLGSITAQDHHSLLVPAGGTWREGAAPLDRPMPARTASETDGLLVPVSGNTYAAGDYCRTRSTGEPFVTQTTDRDKALVLSPLVIGYNGRPDTARPVSEPSSTVMPEPHHSLLMPYNRTGQPKPVDRPAQTLTATQGQALVGGQVRVEDCTFRMLEPHEIGAAMAFPQEYEVKGNKRERVRQYGNAVTPPVMKWLIEEGTECLR